jgi:hypothetical protein
MAQHSLSPATLLRWAGIVSALCLATLWAAYYLTSEPSASVKVRWREGLPAQQRAEKERRYLLVLQETTADGWTRYDLLDTGRRNIEALVRDADASDTTDLDRDAMAVPFHADYGKSWVWAAYRMPGLREPGVLGGVIGGLVGMVLLAGFVELLRRRT